MYLGNFKVKIKIKVIFEKYEPADDADRQIYLVSPKLIGLDLSLYRHVVRQIVIYKIIIVISDLFTYVEYRNKKI